MTILWFSGHVGDMSLGRVHLTAFSLDMATCLQNRMDTARYRTQFNKCLPLLQWPFKPAYCAWFHSAILLPPLLLEGQQLSYEQVNMTSSLVAWGGLCRGEAGSWPFSVDSLQCCAFLLPFPTIHDHANQFGTACSRYLSITYYGTTLAVCTTKTRQLCLISLAPFSIRWDLNNHSTIWATLTGHSDPGMMGGA